MSFEHRQKTREISETEAPDMAATTELLADQPTVALPADYQPERPIDQNVGPYRLIREIGRGGMGAVYLAERADDEFRRQVAVKVVKRGMDTDFIVRRFRNERQILASLDHPNIARLLDGGTTREGLPYFVMEYIEGVPFGTYCDEQRLSTAERLKLFRSVCSAVHYAHQNLVIHRDIKPANILVTPDGVPKLLDFGIAKLLNPDLSPFTLEATESAVRLMTPDYASPEQVRGAQITTASDVYSLGVLLYELLTGHKPYRITSYQPHEIARVICEQEPEKPSTAINRVEQGTRPVSTGPASLTPQSVSRSRDSRPEKLRRQLEGDLDNIILMAMRKEPERRYASVEQFAEDVRRHLEGLPVIARKDTLGYRGGKFIRRHKAAVFAAALVLLTLVAGVVATAWQARVARAERARAERRFNDVRKLANSIMFELHDAIEDLAGSTPARELLVKRALEYLDGLAQEAAGDPSLQRELARAYQKVGDVQGYPYDANLGDTAGAMESYRKALAISEAVVAANPTDNEARRDVLVSRERIGDTLSATGDMAGAVENHRAALAISEQLAAADPSNNKARLTLLISHIKVGEVQAATGDLQGALETYSKGREIAEALVRDDPANASARRAMTIIYNKVGDMQLETGDAAGALEGYRKVLAMREETLKADPSNGQAQRDVAGSLEKVATALAAMGDTAGALASQTRALGIDQALVAADPENAEAQLDLSLSHSNIGELMARAGDAKAALESYRKALAIAEKLSAGDPANAEVKLEVADNHFRIASLLARGGDVAASAEGYNKALAISEQLAAADPENADLRGQLANSYFQAGETFAALASDAKAAAGRKAAHWRDARAWYKRSMEAYTGLKNRGTLHAHGAEKMDEVARAMAKADAALAGVSAPN
jgi:serine/threonine protein kinase/tetratricopeptide (TPR) repeat protein